MNERIKQLCLRAGTCVNNSNGQYTFDEFLAFQEKFAQLIVNECADIADQESKTQRSNYGKQAADQIWHTIKNRFGVE